MHYLRSTKTAFTFLISLIFFFFISGIYAQKPTLKEKVISNSDKYLPYGMDLKKYDWSDKEMNLLLEEVEKYRISRKKLLVAGGIGIGLGVLTHFYNMDSNPGNCNSYFLGYDKCKDTKKLY
ncbi:MAG: hypothetical protein P1U70_13240 [Saprospiraceae bacterium]|jgi:hypothetical protein|nr:hypothetical protein [Saprospiraceae bacterium]